MSEYIFDFSEAIEFDRTPVPAGIYKSIVDTSFASDLKESVNGNRYFTLAFDIIDGEYEGRKLFTNCMLTGKGAGFTKAILKNLGYYDNSQGSRVKFNINELHGIGCDVKVKIGKHYTTGEPQNDVITVTLSA